MKRSQAVGQRAIYLVSKPNFQTDILGVRSFFSIPANGFRSEAELEAWLQKNVYKTIEGNTLYEQIEQAVAFIINKSEYKLSSVWQHSIERYLFLNDPGDMQLPSGITFKIVRDENTRRPEIHVVITNDVTKAEYLDHWKRVVELREELGVPKQAKQRPASKQSLVRGKYAYDLWIAKQSYADIAKALEEREPNKVFVADDAKTIVSNFRKQAGI